MQRTAAKGSTTGSTDARRGECGRCGHRITLTGVIAAADQEADTPVGFCECCRTIQAEREGVWEPLGHGL